MPQKQFTTPNELRYEPSFPDALWRQEPHGLLKECRHLLQQMKELLEAAFHLGWQDDKELEEPPCKRHCKEHVCDFKDFRSECHEILRRQDVLLNTAMALEVYHHEALEDLASSLQKSHEEEILKEHERHVKLLETARVEFWCEVARGQVIFISSKEAHDQIEAWRDVMDSMDESHEDEIRTLHEGHRNEMLEQQKRYEDIIKRTCAQTSKQKEQVAKVVEEENSKEQIPQVATSISSVLDKLALESSLGKPCTALKAEQLAEPIESSERNEVLSQDFLAPKQHLVPSPPQTPPTPKMIAEGKALMATRAADVLRQTLAPPPPPVRRLARHFDNLVQPPPPPIRLVDEVQSDYPNLVQPPPRPFRAFSRWRSQNEPWSHAGAITKKEHNKKRSNYGMQHSPPQRR